MSSETLNPIGNQAEAAGGDGDPVGSIRSIAAENEAGVRRLRSAQIPQHVGMAAACRALAVELPRALAAQVDADLSSGALAQRWETVRAAAAEPGVSGEFDSTLAALALLLRDQGRAVMRHLVRREKEWAADAYRLEGHADALEAQVHQLRRVVGTVPATDDGATTSDAAPLAAELGARPTVEPAPGAR